jgi:glyoxylase-like metal-dependent hydrolase (beta-lactamase superfamily II)/rhodanese-related sulfurtransferase
MTTQTDLSYTVDTYADAEGCRAYLVIDKDSKQALAIDPRLDQVAAIEATLQQRGAKLIGAIDTHTHADHLSGVEELARRTGSKYYAHTKSKRTQAVQRVHEHTELTLGMTKAQLLPAPGHTPDSVAILIGDHLFTGDALFVGGAGRVDFPGGSPEELYETFQRFGGLPAHTIVMPGHVYGTAETSTLFEEQRSNPLYAQKDRSALVAQLSGEAEPPDNMLAILRHNMGQVPDSPTVSAKDTEMLKRSRADLVLLDVRTPAEYAGEHIDGAKLIPLDRLGERKNELQDARQIIVVCRSGGRAQLAADQLQGLRGKVQVLEGGMLAWNAAGLPTKLGAKRTLPLDRQVQLTIGTFTLLGTLAGAFLSPWALIVPAFMGAGLVFAGATGFCGLALVMGRMPWNRVAGLDQGATCSTGTKSACAAPVAKSACAAPVAKSACAAPVKKT